MTEDNVIYATIERIMDSRVDRAARDKLLGAVGVRLGRISDLAGADSDTPSIFVGQFFFISCVSCTISIFQLTANIGCIDISFLVQATLDIR